MNTTDLDRVKTNRFKMDTTLPLRCFYSEFLVYILHATSRKIVERKSAWRGNERKYVVKQHIYDHTLKIFRLVVKLPK